MNNEKQYSYQELQTLIRKGDLKKAEQELGKFIKLNPKDEVALSLLGHCYLRQNEIKKSINVFEKIIELYPASAQSHADLGFAWSKLGNTDAAIKAYKQSVKLEPHYSEVWHFLGNLLMEKHRPEEARKAFTQSDQTDPFRSEISKIEFAMNHNNFSKAEKLCVQILQKHNSHPKALAVMIQLATQVGAHEDAEKMLRHGIKFSPYNANFWFKLTGTLAMTGKHAERTKAAKRTVELEPKITKAWVNLGGAFAASGQYNEALDAYDKSEKLDSKDANIQLQRGHILKILGRREECEQAYRKCAKLKDINGAAYWALADLKNVVFSENDIRKMKSIFESKNAPAEQAAQAGFALAKAHEDKQQYEKAFELYDQANKLRPGVIFNPNDYHEHIENTKIAFSSEILKTQSTIKSNPTPIFIVGLPRAGSTLVEQILASHSKIEGTKELDNLPLIMGQMNNIAHRNGHSFPNSMSSFDSRDLAKFGEQYMEETGIFRSGKRYFIDKLPTNFRLIGLIHMILPDAIVIDVRRHPLDNGFSTFKQHFAGGHDFSYDLENIAHYYNGYLNIMDYWDKVLPGKVHLLQYEKLVQDTEQEICNLLNHCGLEYEQSCMKFHKNRRAVNTASSEQVRQPITNKNIGYWKNFEKQMEPMKIALGSKTIERFQ